MKNSLVLSTLLATFTVAVHAADAPADSRSAATANTQAPTSMPHADFCFLAGAPPSDIQYSKIEQIKLGKSSYGGVSQILDEFAVKASSLGADAIINYAGSQRFGFWPWRFVRPVVRGMAIKWISPKPDCKAVGGSTLQEIVASNKAPT